MAADFNLSAEISVQLAKNAASVLQTQLDNANIVLKIDDQKIVSGIKAGAKAAKDQFAKDIAAIVKIDVQNKDEFDKLFEARKVAVTLDFKAENIIKNLNALVKKTLADAGIKIAKKQAAAPAAVTTGNAPAGQPPAGKNSQKTKKALTVLQQEKEAIRQLIESYEAWRKEAKLTGRNSGEFLASAEQSVQKLYQLSRQIGKVSIATPENLASMFAGFGNSKAPNAAKNMFSALTEVFKASKALSRQTDKLEDAKKLNIITDKQYNAQKALLDKASDDIGNYITSFDVGNPQAFRAVLSDTVSRATSGVSNLLRESSKEVRDYERLLTGLKQQRTNVILSRGGGSSEQVSVLDRQIALVEASRDASKKLGATKADPFFQVNESNIQNLNTAQKLLLSTGDALETIRRKATQSGLTKTIGAEFIGLEKILNDLVVSSDLAKKSILSSQSIGPADKAAQIAAIGKANAEAGSRSVKDSETVTNLYERLVNAQSAFTAGGFNEAAKSLGALMVQFEGAARSGQNLDDVRRLTEKGLIDTQQLAKDEAGLNRMLTALDRVKASLNTAATDYADIGKRISSAEAQLGAQFKAKTGPRDMKDSFNKNLFDIRQANAFNTAVDNTVIKLTELGDRSKTEFSAKVYSDQIAAFQAYAGTVINKSADMATALRTIKVAGDEAIFGAKYQAAGGFFNQIAEAAGLATKRLGAFLFFAQGLYKIQNAMELALQSAIALDKEFIKFEQIFNKTTNDAAVLEGQLGSLQKTVFNLAKTYGVASTEIANAGKILAQAGIVGVPLEKSLQAIAKASLGPTFEDMGETAETTVAIMNQFGLSADKLETTLGGINRVAAKFPVEAEGITSGVRRAGGAFAAAGGRIDEFAAAFTIIKKKTREADETIATSMRNIAISLQSTKIQKFIKDSVGADLLDSEGRFKGFAQSIEAIGAAVQRLGLQGNDPKFAELVEGIAGKRQFTRLLPLLQDYKELKEIQGEFAKGAGSLDEDVSVALESIESKLIRAREAVSQLFTEIIRSDVARALVDGFTAVTKVVTGLLRALNSVSGVLLGIAGLIAIFPKLGIATKFFLSPITGGRATTPFTSKNIGGEIAAAQGYLPGGGPNQDSFIAALTRGEYVVQRSAVQKYGVGFLDKLNGGAFNKGGLIPGFVEGGFTGNVDPFTFAKSMGLKISQTLLKTIVSSITVGKLAPGINGGFNRKDKAIALSRDLSLEDQLNTGAHEIGHAISDALSSNQAKKLTKSIENLPPAVREATLSRMESSGKYGARGSKEFNQKAQRELQADVFKMVSQRARGSQKFDPATNKVLDEAQSIFRTAGVGFQTPPVSTIDTIRAQQAAANSDRYPLKRPPQSRVQFPFSRTGSFKYQVPTGTDDDNLPPSRLQRRASKQAAAFNLSPRGKKKHNIQVRERKGFSLLNQLGGFEDTSSTLGPIGTGSTSPFKGGKNVGAAASLSGFSGNVAQFNGSPMKALSKAIDITTSRFSKLAIVAAALIAGFAGFSQTTSEQRETMLGMTTAAAEGAASFLAFKQVIAGILTILPQTKGVAKASKFVPQLDFVKKTGIGFGKRAPTNTADILKSIKGSAIPVGQLNQTKSKFAQDTLAAFRNSKNAGFISAGPSTQQVAAGAVKTKGIFNSARGIKAGASLASFKTATTAAAGLAKQFNFIGIAVAAATAALSFFANKTAETADAEIAAAKTEAEALKAFEKKRTAIGAGSAIKGAGGALGGALGGAALGAIGGPFGIAVGAFVGGLIGFLTSGSDMIKNSPILSTLGNMLSILGKQVLGAVTTSAKFLLAVFNDIDNTYAQLSDKLFGTNLVQQKQQREAQGRQGASNLGRLAEISGKQTGPKGEKNSTLLTKDGGKDLGAIIGIATAGQKKRERKGAFDNFDTDIAPQIAAEAQRIKDILSIATPLEQARIVEAAKKNGLDMVQYFKDNGVEFDLAAIQAKVAFDKMGLFFAGITSTVDLANARLAGISAGFEGFTDPSSRQFASDASFDIVRAGFNPAQLGFDDRARQNLSAQARAFSPELAKAAAFEEKGLTTTRNLREGLLKNPNLQLNTEGLTSGETLDKFLKESFDKIGGGDADLNTLFSDFLDTKTTELGEAISGGGVDVNKVNNLLSEFADGLDKGALEALRKINEVNKKFGADYQALADKRISIEQEVTGLLNSNLDKRKAINDIDNKASGLVGRALLPRQRQQAAAIDSGKLTNILRGTGVAPGSSAQAIGAALRASQVRQAGLERTAVNGVAGNINNQGAIALEKERQLKLQEGLKYIAGGTETAALAMQEFEMAAERAARSSAFLTNALLGTDDQLMSTVKGLYAQQRIESAGNPQQAMAVLANLSSSAREGLNSVIGQDAEATNRFQSALGIAPTISNLPETKGAKDAVGGQQEAQLELAASLKTEQGILNASIEGLKKFYVTQFSAMQTGINSFHEVVNKVSEEIKSMPTVVKHEINGKVEINVVGAGALAALTPAMQEIVNAEVSKQMSAFGAELAKNNQGIQVPQPTALSKAAKAIGTGLGFTG